MDAIRTDPGVSFGAPRLEGLRYRPELDGLRAVAVLAVIATHLGLPGFTGGFIGVDVFFVLSGYLIFADLQTRHRTAMAFYDRRLRRILPAYYTMLAASLIAGGAFLMPGDFTQMARGLLAAVLLVPNLLFLTQSGYFEHPASLNPLLHSWSLGVEAQFYLIAPFLSWLLLRRPPASRKRLLIALTAGALIMGIAIRALGHSAAFYLMPSRLWEFLLGGLAASQALPVMTRQWYREALAAMGLAALLACLWLFTGATAHPGLLTLIPCLGTVAIIQATGRGETWTGRLLGLRGLVFTGSISYSLYLWHWPLIVFARYAQLPFTLLNTLLGVVLLVALSVLTWTFIETPLRRPRAGGRTRFVGLGAAGAMLIIAGLVVLGLRGLPQRFPSDVAQIADYYDFGDRMPYREGQCFLTSRQRFDNYKAAQCLHLEAGVKNVLVFGDSHAAHLWPALHAAWPHVNFLQATASGCKPSLTPVGAPRCTALVREIVTDFLPAHPVDAIVIAALWEDADLKTLRDLLPRLAPDAKEIDLVGPVPRYDEPAATLLALSLLHHDLDDVAAHRLPSVPALDRDMASFATTLPGPVHYVSPYQALCPDDKCLLFAAPGVPLQFDYHHLTAQGGERLVGLLKASGALRF